MRYISILLLLIIVSCKDDVKTKKETESRTVIKKQIKTASEIDKSPAEMWEDYIKSNPKFKDEEIPEFDFFHNNREDANRLAELTLTNKKKASSGLYSLYKQYNVDLPSVGTKLIVTNFDGKAKAIIQNVSIDTIPFNKISKKYAELDLGTNIDPLEKWKKAHWNFFESFLKESGEKPTENMLIVCIMFEKIWPE